ncbi:MAG TPA: SpoIIE family protein phosphatase [Ignavibacteria bacterium]|nr:SpoIIE family protein phosphatase [Ignavibacteria bacterium]
MRFFKNLSESSYRFLYIFIAIFSITLIGIIFLNTMIINRFTVDDCLWVDKMENKSELDTGFYIVQIVPGGVADDAGIQNGDILLNINGNVVSKALKTQELLNTFANEYITYTIKRGDLIFDTKIWVYKFFNVNLFIFCIFGFFFIVVSLMAGYSKPKEPATRLFFFLGITTALGLLTYSAFNFTSNGANYMIFILLACSFLFPPLFIHFFLTYPIKYEFKQKKYVLYFSYAFLGLYVLIAQFILLPLFKYSQYLFYIRLILTFLYIFIGLVIFYSSYKKLKNSETRKPLNILLTGLIIGTIGMIYFFTIQIFQTSPVFLLDPLILLPSALSLAIPFSFGYSIFKYKILDTEFIVKRSLVFGILTLFIISIYLIILYIINVLFRDYLRFDTQIIVIVTVIILTLSFDFIQNKVRNFVDKQFYKRSYNYRQSLLDFTRELPYLNNINEIFKKVITSVSDLMAVKNISLWIKDKEYEELLDRNYVKYFNNHLEMRESENDTFLERIYSENKEPVLFYESDLMNMNLTDLEIEIIKKRNITISVPIVLKSRVIGALQFGQKGSEKPYSDEDIDLLKTLASQCAISFENARLQREELAKEKIEEEIKVAKQIQDELKPTIETDITGLDISSYSQPAKMIGGDFYDILKIDENKILVVVADVSGKGIPAALNMSKIQAMLKFASGVFETPKELLSEINSLIYEKIDRRSFVTMIVALFDLESNKVKIARAGHNPAIIQEKNEFKVIMSKGLGLGLESDKLFNSNLEELEISFDKNQFFVFYSDGLSEAMNENREEFSTNKLIEIVKQNQNFDSKTVVDRLVGSVKQFTGFAEQFDDITLVVVKT